tara:strand:+ start:322 stop:1239 length:918 start_codon:yes stop_codon:yes gene_type:complete
MAKKLSRREEKLAKIREADKLRDREFTKTALGGGRERVGQYVRDREGARDTSGTQLKNIGKDNKQTYIKSDGSSETFDAELAPKSKRKQRALDRETLRDARKERRANRIAEKKGMSVSQAQDFMNNRRDRLNAAMGEFGKGLVGQEQNLSRIKDREYRKRDRGTRAEDYKPFADSTTRTKTYYDNVIGKEDLKKSNVTLEGGEIKIPKVKPIKKPGKPKTEQPQQTIELTQSNLENTLEPTTVYSARTTGNTFDDAIFTESQQKENQKRDLDMRGGSVQEYVGPFSKLDRSTMQENMSSIKGRRG